MIAVDDQGLGESAVRESECFGLVFIVLGFFGGGAVVVVVEGGDGGWWWWVFFFLL